MIFKNSSEITSAAGLTNQVFSRAPAATSDHDDVFRVLAKTEAHGAYFKLTYFANTIPYLQGLLLYILSVAFPFFAVFLVVPDRAMSFVAWCGMWVWVKTWDIGFAAVHVVRDLLWTMLNGQMNKHDVAIDWNDPSTIFSVIYDNDPFYSLNTYWIVVSLLTCSVPFLTAHFCLGATGLFSMFSGAIDQTPESIGNVEKNRSRRFVANVNEHIQRNTADAVARAYALEGGSQATHPVGGFSDSDSGEGGGAAAPRTADAGGGGVSNSSDQVAGGATDHAGNPIVDSRHGGRSMSAPRASLAQSHYRLGKLLAQVGTRDFQTGHIASAVEAQKQGSPHFMRGMVPMSREISFDAAKRLVGGDESRAREMIGQDSEGNRVGAGLTWGDVFARSSDFQMRNQALTAGITGRRATNPQRIEGGTQGFLSQRQQQQDHMREPATASNMAIALGIDSLMKGWLGRGAGLPSQYGEDGPKKE